MPTYEYACTACGDHLEVVQSFTDSSLTVCPACQGKLRKVFSPVGVVFKGSGFYKTDSRSKSSIEKSSADKGTDKGSSEKSSTEKGSTDKGSADKGSADKGSTDKGSTGKAPEKKSASENAPTAPKSPSSS
ncbi:MAG TPA: FmdB family zinc ribbon protein [Mycobacteriales bacterium]|nr:FmdB family zinc ribbon protein [Mycobacteriales bacterium]